MELITFRKLTETEKIEYFAKAVKENRLKFLFDIRHDDFDKITRNVIYGVFYQNAIKGFYYFYNLNEQTVNIAFGYFGNFNKNGIAIIRHCIKTFRKQYSIIGEVNELNTATIRLCRVYLFEPLEFIMPNADNNNTARHIFYWSKTNKESEVTNGK